MKKILVMVFLTLSLSVSAFWNNNNTPWGGFEDSGIFGFNPYNYWDPNWYSQEMNNMIDEFDDNRYNRYNGYNRYNNNGYNNPYTRGNSSPWGRGYNFR